MESIPRKPLRAAVYRSLVLLGLTCLLGTADARPMLPSERFPGPWLEVTQEVRDFLTLNKVAACSQAAGREIVEQSRRISPVLHIGREALDQLARTTRGALRSRPGQAVPGYRTAGWILRIAKRSCRAKNRGSPAEGTSERRAPIMVAAWARVAEFAARAAPPLLDAALRLAAQQHHELRSLAGLRAHPLVRDDQGGSRRNGCDAIQCILRNHDAVERGLCAVRVRRHRLDVAAATAARPVLWLDGASTAQ